MPDVQDAIFFDNPSPTGPAQITVEPKLDEADLYIQAQADVELRCGASGSVVFITDAIECGRVSAAEVTVSRLTMVPSSVTEGRIAPQGGAGPQSFDSDRDLIVSANRRVTIRSQPRAGARPNFIWVRTARGTALRFVTDTGATRFLGNLDVEAWAEFPVGGVVIPKVTSAPTAGAGDGAACLAEVGNDDALYVFASGTWRSITL